MTLRHRLLAVAVVTFAIAIAAIDARSTYGARVSSDEPQYLLTAISLGEDLDLDISDEIAEGAYRPFHEVALNEQTIELNASGQRLSPHDPLLPAILAGPVRLGGWVGAKLTLAAIVAVTAVATTWLAVRRFGVGERTAMWVIGAFFAAPPLTSYGSQIYPAAPAALLVVVGLSAVTTPRPSRGADAAALAAIVALPWLAVKYVPLAFVLTAALCWQHRHDRRRIATLGVVLGAMGALYLVVHHRIYGGWTVYAAGDHFVGGEFTAVGTDPNYLGRSRRLLGLLIDRGFGIAAWTPAYILMPLGLVAVARRSAERVLLLVLVAAGWATATWVALTMHGWWWPGRQVVPILPLVAVAIAVWVDRSTTRLVAVITATLAGTATWLWLAWEASTGRRTIIVDFEDTPSPWYRAARALLPDHRSYDVTDAIATLVWGVILGSLVVAAAARSVQRRRQATVSAGGPDT